MNINSSGRLALCAVLLSASFVLAQSPPAITEFPLPGALSSPTGIAAGSDGALWFAAPPGSIGRTSTAGTITFFPAPGSASPGGIAPGPDGALWFASGNNDIGRITTSGAVTFFPIPTGIAQPYGITAGPDGALWFTELVGNKIGRITTTGVITEYPVPTAASSPYNITAGPDGALWFTEQGSNKIGRITIAGAFTEFAIPTPNSQPEGIALGSDGALWFTELTGNQIGRITTTGTVLEFFVTGGSGPAGIVAGPDGALWFTEGPGNRIGRITTTAIVSEYGLPSAGSFPLGITVGPDGAIWFAETGFGANKIARAAIFAPGTSLQITAPTTLPTGAVGTPYSESLTAIGGTPPYTWSVTTGSLPAGLTLATNGVISGTPTTVGPQSFTLQATDAITSTVMQVSSMTIGQPSCTYAVSSSGQVFTAAGGPGSFIVTAGAGCAWVVSGAPSWVTIVSGGSGTGDGIVSQVVNFTVAPNPSATLLTGTVTVAGVTFSLSEQPGVVSSFGVMPHLAAEGGWRTTFTLVNKGSVASSTQLSLLDNNGNPLALPLTLPQQPSLPAVTEASTFQAIPANGSFIVQASGPANVAFLEGSAQVTSSGGVDGFAIFHFDPSNQEAVVPLQPGNGTSSLLAFDDTSTFTTGIAIEMTSNQGGGVVGVTLRDDTGAQIGTGTESITLAPGGHTSFVLPTLFPVTANIRGTVQFNAPCLQFGSVGPTSSVCSQISALGIRYTPPGTLTTIPPLSQVLSSQGSLAHLASGGGWQTTFVLVNTSTASAAATLKFFDNSGNPLALPLTFPQSGVSTNAASVTVGVGANASLYIQTTGAVTDALLTGSAQLTTNSPITGFAVYRYVNGQEASAPLETRNAGSYVLAFDNTSQIVTGLAISAVSTQAVNVPVIVRDDTGHQVFTGSLPLAANGHFSQNLTAAFPATAGIRGTVEFDTPSGAQISVLGIRSPLALTFTTLPALAK